MGLEDFKLERTDAWLLPLLWSSAEQNAEIVKISNESSAQASLVVRSAFAEAKAQSEIREAWVAADAQARAKSRELKNWEDIVRAKEQIDTEFKAKQKDISDRLAVELAALNDEYRAEMTKAQPKKRAAIYAKLVDPKGGTTCDTFAGRPPKSYYVIVGRGTAAVLNHSLLRQTAEGQNRLNGVGNTPLEVLHIGLPDPWFYYHAHGMGQPPYLLSLPGFHFRPTHLDRTIRSGMHSNDFAFRTLQEWSLLKMKYNFPHLQGWVAVIQRRGDELAAWVPSAEWSEFTTLRGNIAGRWTDAWPGNAPEFPYRLIVVRPDESLELVYAEKIDICTGLGRASVQAVAPHHTVANSAPAPMLQEMRNAAPLLWLPPDMWDDTIRNRAIVTGPEALYDMTAWDSRERIYVNGGGGIGLNMIERSEDEGCYADWLHRGTLHDSFNLERNDTVLKDPISGGPRNPGTSGLRNPDASLQTPMPAALTNLIPCDRRWRFGRNATVNTYTAVTRDMNGRLVVSVTHTPSPAPTQQNPNPPPTPPAAINDYNDAQAPPGGTALQGTAFPFSVFYQNAHSQLNPADGVAGRYDRVFCTGGQNGNSLGGAQQLTAGMGLVALNRNGRVVAMETANHHIRVLGATTFGYPNYPALVGGGASATRTYFETLPISAVPPGFIFSGINIAEANGFFATAPNVNVNTATRAELGTYFQGKGANATDADNIARAIVDLRRRVNGFASPQAIINAFQAHVVGANPLASVTTATVVPNWQTILAQAQTNYPQGGPLLG